MKVAFIGHRTTNVTQTLRDRLSQVIEELIVEEKADTFFFGSKSRFNDLCYEVVTELKSRYDHIRRIYVRAEYEYIDTSYASYILSFYENTFFPSQVHGAGALSYVKRNQVMIDLSDVSVAYCDMNYIPRTKTKSGTRIAVAYAMEKKKRVINLFV